MFLGTQRTIAFVSKPRGRCLCRGRRNLTWSRSSGSAGAGSAIHPRVRLAAEVVALAGWEATSNRMAWTTGGHLSRVGWRVTHGREVLEDYGRLTAPCTASWHRHQGPHLSMSEPGINRGTINRTPSRDSRSMRRPQRAARHPVPQGKRMPTLVRKM